jgi:hypothetical protein
LAAVANVLLKAEKAAPEIEALSSLFFPQAVELERGAFALLGRAAQAVSEAAMQRRQTASTSRLISNR